MASSTSVVVGNDAVRHYLSMGSLDDYSRKHANEMFDLKNSDLSNESIRNAAVIYLFLLVRARNRLTSSEIDIVDYNKSANIATDDNDNINASTFLNGKNGKTNNRTNDNIESIYDDGDVFTTNSINSSHRYNFF